MIHQTTVKSIWGILSLGLLLSFGQSTFGQTSPCPGCIPSSQIPGGPGSGMTPSPGSPTSATSGWTVPVPDRFSVNQSGQVMFIYNNQPFSSGVPVTGINPFQVFNGSNGLPHWSTMTGSSMGGPDPMRAQEMMQRFQSNPYGSLNTWTNPGGPLSPSPIQVSSVYNSFGFQVSSNGMAQGFSPTLLNPTSSLSSYQTSFSNTTSSLSSNTNSALNNYLRTDSAAQANQALSQMQRGTADSLTRATTNLLGSATSLTESGSRRPTVEQYRAAAESLNHNLELEQQAGHKVEQAVTHASLAQIYLALGEGQNAASAFKQALQVSEKTGDLKMQTAALRGMGAAHLMAGEGTDALEAYRRARTLTARLTDRTAEAEVLTGMGWVYQSSGDPRQALLHYREALALLVKGGDRAAEARTRVGIGLLYHSLGEPNKALDEYRAALEIAKVTLTVTDAELAGLFAAVGEVYQAAGMKKKALEVFEKAQPLMKEANNKSGEASILASLGRASAYAGLLTTALTYYQDALRLMREDGNRAGEAGVLASIGEVYYWEALKARYRRALGGTGGPTRSENFPKTLQRYEEALAVMKALGNQVGEIGIRINIGLVYDAWDKPEQALAAYHQAITALENQRASAHLEEFRTSLAQQAAAVYQRAIALHLQRNQPAQAFELSERARARTFLDQLGNAKLDLRKGADAALIAQEQALRQPLAALETQLAQERARPAAQLNQTLLQSLETQLAAKRKAYEDLLTRLKLAQPEYASLVSVATLTLPQAQQLLTPEVTLVSYFVTPDYTLAFVLTRNTLHTVKLAVTQWELETAITNFRDFSNLSEAQAPELKQLHKWLIAPLKGHLKTPQVGIIPHGVLHNLPFAALTDGRQYLSDSHTLFYLPSVSALPFLRRKPTTGGAQMLALAYGQAEGMPVLRFAEAEAETIAQLYGAQPRLGTAASKAAFRADAGTYDILHLATHYQPNAANPLFSRLLLSPGAEDDGGLALHEVYGLELKRADLVMLSACQTQVGAQSRGDEIASLNRAFMYAGAPTVIASLWSVDDQATSQWMTSFYTHLKEGMGKATALRAAQVETRAKYPHPYYWAAFVLNGDPGVVSALNISAESRSFKH